jgi:hypothetical protein
MKRIFSKYRFVSKWLAKECKCSMDEITRRAISRTKEDPITALIVDAEGIAIHHESSIPPPSIKFLKPLHYFIEGDGMCQWLQQSAPKLSEDKIKFITNFLKERPFFLHFEGKGVSSRLVVLIHMGALYCGAVCKSLDNSKEKATAEIFGGVHFKGDEVNLISGFISYISCFPEMVHDGVPTGIIHPAHYKHCKSFHVSPLIEHDRGSATPHFRSGHFRILSSERFTHKRYQVIFIKECFVKGEAKTVEGIT